ncbi:MAG: GlxA family transcriptional regulator [Methyloligellaceae bacterium]
MRGLDVHQIDIVLTDGFPALSLTLLTEPMRVANRESLEEAFGWRFLSQDGGMMLSSSGIGISSEVLDDTPRDAVILLSSYHPESAATPALKRWLRAQARRGVLMGCVDTAALIFAESGLLSTMPAAAHFEALPGYIARFPEHLFVDRLYDFSPPRCSSAGGVATVDMTIALLTHFSSARLAQRVSEILTYIPSDHPGAQERLLPDRSLAYVNHDLAGAVDIMIATIHMPISVDAIAARLDLPVWRLAQLFKRFLRTSPSAHYRRLRLERARNLLRNSHHPVGEIGSLSGFVNHETFTRAYAREYGCPPSKDRGT